MKMMCSGSRKGEMNKDARITVLKGPFKKYGSGTEEKITLSKR